MHCSVIFVQYVRQMYRSRLITVQELGCSILHTCYQYQYQGSLCCYLAIVATIYTIGTGLVDLVVSGRIVPSSWGTCVVWDGRNQQRQSLTHRDRIGAYKATTTYMGYINVGLGLTESGVILV